MCTFTTDASFPSGGVHTPGDLDAARIAHPELFFTCLADAPAIFEALMRIQFRLPADTAAAKATRDTHTRELHHFLEDVEDATEEQLAVQHIAAWMDKLYGPHVYR